MAGWLYCNGSCQEYLVTFRSEGTIQDFLKEQDIPGIAGIGHKSIDKDTP